MGFWSDSLPGSVTSKSAINMSGNEVNVVVIVYVIPCKDTQYLDDQVRFLLWVLAVELTGKREY